MMERTDSKSRVHHTQSGTGKYRVMGTQSPKRNLRRGGQRNISNRVERKCESWRKPIMPSWSRKPETYQNSFAHIACTPLFSLVLRECEIVP